MNEQAAESLSAMMDGEASEFELRRNLEQAEQSGEAGERWRRYHVARAAMRGEPVAADIDISDRVMAALADEPTYSMTPEEPQADVAMAERRKESRNFWKPIASMAMAASVTAVVILGVQHQNSELNPSVANSPITLPANQSASTDLAQVAYGDKSSRSVDASQAQPDVIRLSQGLERYITQHRYLLSSHTPQWQAGWLPDGFSRVRHEVMPDGREMMMYSDGKSSVSVCIEAYGRQSVAEGAAQAEGMIAVGKRQGNQFITVVGNIPLVVAERIAQSVNTL